MGDQDKYVIQVNKLLVILGKTVSTDQVFHICCVLIVFTCYLTQSRTVLVYRQTLFLYPMNRPSNYIRLALLITNSFLVPVLL